jgi:hypothetical protein
VCAVTAIERGRRGDGRAGRVVRGMSTLRERMRDAARTAAAAVRREDDDALGGDVFASTTPNARAMRSSSGWNASTRMRVMDKPAAAVTTPTRGEEEDAARRARRRWRAEFDRVKADKLASDSSPTTTQQRQEERVVRVWGDAVTTSMTRRRAQKDGYRGAEPTTSASLKEKFQRTVRERDEARARVDAMRLESQSVVTTHEAPAAAAMDDGGDVEREVLQILREVVQETNRATVSAAAAPAVTPASKLVNIAAPVVSSSPVPSSPLRARSLDAKMDYSNARRSRQSGRLEKKSREEICALALAHVKQRQTTWRTIATIIVAIVAVIAGLARRRLPVVETTDERRFKCPEFVSNNVLEEALEPSWRSALKDARATHDAHIARGDALGAKTIRAHSKRARDAQRALGALNADIERFFASVSADADTRSRTTPDTTADTTTTDTTTAADRARVKFAVARARALARAADAFDALRVLLADDAPL